MYELPTKGKDPTKHLPILSVQKSYKLEGKKNNKTLHLEGRGNEDRKLEFILNPISKGWGFKKREQVLQENRDDNTPTKAIIHMYSLEYII